MLPQAISLLHHDDHIHSDKKKLRKMPSFEERAELCEFHATAVLLSQLSSSNQQHPAPRSIGSPAPNTSIPSSKFLDRLARLLACCKRMKDVRSGVCASVLVRTRNGNPKIYLAKNMGFSASDEALVRDLQQLMRNVAVCSTDKTCMRTTIVTHNRPLIEHYINDLAKITTAQLEDICRSATGKARAQALHNSCIQYQPGANVGTTPQCILRQAAQLRNKTREGCITHAQHELRRVLWSLGNYLPHTRPSSKPRVQTHHSRPWSSNVQITLAEKTTPRTPLRD
jgi:hypothetical protein